MSRAAAPPPAMLATLEVRWFVAGELPRSLLGWFDGLGPPVEPASRADRYHAPSSPREPGIKLREDRIEVKTRTAANGAQPFGRGLEGAAESFSKWSFVLAEPSAAPAAGWLAVGKSRRQRTFGFDGDAPVVSEARGTPELRCEVELGEISLAQRSWWTLCLEAAGPDHAARRRILSTTALRVFASWPARPRLAARQSMGYVAWLCGALAA